MEAFIQYFRLLNGTAGHLLSARLLRLLKWRSFFIDGKLFYYSIRLQFENKLNKIDKINVLISPLGRQGVSEWLNIYECKSKLENIFYHIRPLINIIEDAKKSWNELEYKFQQLYCLESL